VNVFVDPQFTVYHDGTGLPSFQLFSGLLSSFERRRAETRRSASR
jgi:hypothetical protein